MSDRQRRPGVVIAIGNQKGGVAKTTNCVHIAAALGSLGRSCLVWDMGPNQGATLQFGVDGAEYYGSYEVLIGVEQAGAAVLRNGDGSAALPSGVGLIPASDPLARLSRIDDWRGDGQRPQDHLRTALDALRLEYDYVLLDTAPDLTPPTAASYLAADWLILSATPEPLSLVGLKHAVAHMREGAAHGVAALLGIVMCRVERGIFSRWTKFDRGLVAYAKDSLGAPDGKSLTFDTTIARSVAVQECQMAGQTLFQMKPKHRVTSQYRALAREIEARIDRLS